ncbi:MAG: DUF1722 domain-containing protein [Desulfobacterales bacterium]|nr:DUF1722 domain-containing protein [Desulfobacterales bacterium]
MKIWDIHAGYLNSQSLIAEHLEIHRIASIIDKKDYLQDAETIHWINHSWALKQRHNQLAYEMELRGFIDKSPMNIICSDKEVWPKTYIEEPCHQFQSLKEKYANQENGRIALPINEQQLWSHHKYSVLARDPNIYKKIGRDIATMKINFSELAILLIEILRIPPKEGGIRNALQHMWGYVSDEYSKDVNLWSLHKLLQEIQKRSIKNSYITNSTALSELMVWLIKE